VAKPAFAVGAVYLPKSLSIEEIEMPETTIRPTWPHLENIDRIKATSPEWFDQGADWVVTEKMHGFNARFGRDADGTPWVGSRSTVVAEGDPAAWPDSLQGFVRFAATRVGQLLEGETVFGEWAGKGIQSIDYGPRDFYVFGAYRETFLGWPDVLAVARQVGLKTVPVLYRGTGLPDMDVLTEWRSAQSLVAAASGREGICLAQDPPAISKYGHTLIGKFKSPAFAEKTSEREERPARDMTGINPFVAEYATEERFSHVLAQVLESGVEPLDQKNTGAVLRAMYEDVVREAGPDFEALSPDDQKFLGKALNPATKRMLDAARLASLA
jgi:hypothetical protein